MVLLVLVCGGCSGYRAGLHAVVGLLESRVCWLVCEHGAVAASRCWMARRTS